MQFSINQNKFIKIYFDLVILNQELAMKPQSFSFRLLNFYTFFFLLLFFACNKEKKVKFETIIPILNGQLSALNLSFDKVPRIDTDDKPLYSISILTNDKVSFPFDKEKYYFKKNTFGMSGDTLTLLRDKVLNLIDSTYLRDEKIFNLLRKTSAVIAFKEAGFSIEQTINTGDFMAEFCIILKKFYGFNFKKIRIYIKGYADYSNRVWYGFQDKKYGAIYKKIQVHPHVNTVNQEFFYQDILQQRVIRVDSFRNNELPNLRAAYLKDIFEGIVKRYSEYTDTKVELLDGSEVGEKGDKADPTKRKGEIIIQIFD